MNKEKCKFCEQIIKNKISYTDELVYYQYVIQDSACQECGEWQNGDYI